MVFQGLLFDDDNEALVQELARKAALDNAKTEAEARKAAWDAGKPVPDDVAKWAAAHRELINSRSRESYRTSYPENSEYYLHSSARYRASKLGCKIGRKGPILKRYRRARNEGLIPCYWCKHLTKPSERHVDHLHPLTNGGQHNAGNLRITCTDCNLSKGDTTPKEFREKVAERRAANSLILSEHYRMLCRSIPNLKNKGKRS